MKTEGTIMTGEAGEEQGSGRKRFLRKHWTVVPILAVVAIAALVGAIRVFLWFAGEAQASGLVPAKLGLWTMGHLVMFFIYLIFWELLFIGIPVLLGAVAGWLWWRRLPAEERNEYHFNRRRSRRSRGGRWMSPLFFIAFCIKVYIDGNWNVAISTWTLDYVVISTVTILVWGLIIFGIPAVIAGAWWLRRKARETP
jgi:hypothetical protein